MYRRDFLKKSIALTALAFSSCIGGKLYETFNVINYSDFADRIPEWRTIEDAVNLALSCNPDYLFRCFPSGGRPILMSCKDIIPTLESLGYEGETAERLAKFLSRLGLCYDVLKNVVSLIKSRREVMFSVTEHTQYAYKYVWDPINKKKMDGKNFALNFAKWGLINPETKKPFDLVSTQNYCAKRMAIVPSELVVNGGVRWITDPTSVEYRKWIVNKCKMYRRVGVDVVHFDILFLHAGIAYRVVKWMRDNGYYEGNPLEHPAVVDLYNSACDLVSAVKDLGLQVETWFSVLGKVPYERMPKLDGTYISPTYREVLSMRFEDERWETFVNSAKERLGERVRLYSFIDNGGLDTYPMHAFSQKLSPEQQRKFLVIWNDYMRSLGVYPVFPLHDGPMGRTIVRKSWGKYPIYDATAPEFNTYPTIKMMCVKK